jgi:hypothetical protein
MKIAVINESSITNEDVRKMTGAVQKQMTWHVCPAWNSKSVTVQFYADKAKVPADAWLISILNNSSQAGALGYHSEDNDLVDGFVFAQPVIDNGGVVLHDPKNNQNVSVASVLSHEICEMFGDRYANFWADGPALPEGSEYALELGDPVEADSYDITLTDGSLVSVSNFVLPSWFNPQGTSKDGPFDYLKKLTKPFSMTKGGYLIVMKSGVVNQVFGEEMPQWKREHKKSKHHKRNKKNSS